MRIIETLKLYTRWWNTWHTIPVLAWVKAAAYYRVGRYDQAEALYRKGLEHNGDHPANLCARLDLAYCLFKANRLEESEKFLRYITANAPEMREGYIRLARLQLWMGNALEASWTMRRASHVIKGDGEVAAIFISSVVEAEAPEYLLDEARRYAADVEVGKCDKLTQQRMELALARYEYRFGSKEEGRRKIAELSGTECPIFDSLLVFAQILLEERRVAHARRQLRRAMTAAPDHPRLLSTLAQSYMQSGPFYCAEYAVQHALKACQNTAWLSAPEMHTLAEAFYHQGDKVSALLMAGKAKQAGSRLMGAYAGTRHLDQLIESLSEGTLA